jgi:hypothetical protein
MPVGMRQDPGTGSELLNPAAKCCQQRLRWSFLKNYAEAGR